MKKKNSKKRENDEVCVLAEQVARQTLDADVTIPTRLPEYVNFFKPFHFLAGDQLGASHISSWLQEIQSREWEERTNEQTNNMLGLTQSARWGVM